MAHLVLEPDREGARVISLHGDYATIGRAPETDVWVQHESLSRTHAAIEAEGGHVYLTDLGSKNGTSLRGEPVTRAEIRDGDVFLCGDMPLRFLSASPEPTEAPSAARRLDALARAARFVPPLADGEVSVDVLASIGFDALELTRLAFVLFDPDTGAAEPRASRAKGALAVEAPRSDILERMRRLAASIRGGAETRAWACVPVRRRGRIVGALHVETTARVEDASLELLECLASIASIAIFR
jgi:GAF domain-containing protein